MGAVVVIQAVYRTFDSQTTPVRALRGCDLSVGHGELVAMMGPSGCGKSTLLNLIAGLDRPDDGTITVAGQVLGDLDDGGLAAMRRQHIGLVFQFFNLLEGMTALENVAIAAMIASTRRRAAEARARDLLGIGDKADHLPGRLSGGQRQRLAIARALANRPTVLLADEPTGALDSDGGAEILELLRRLHRDGQTVLLVTHDRIVAGVADRVVNMRDGRVLEEARRGDCGVAVGLPTDASAVAFGDRALASGRTRWRRGNGGDHRGPAQHRGGR
jgi:putative ABC transport system ATP-binding protein